MFTRLIAVIPWVLTMGLAIVLFYFVNEHEFLQNKIETLSSDNARIAEQRNSVITVNNSMHQTIQLLQQQLDEARDTEHWLSEVKGAMDSKLSKAVIDIKRFTDGKAQDSGSCNDGFSSDVYQRMLDAYETGDSSKE